MGIMLDDGDAGFLLYKLFVSLRSERRMVVHVLIDSLLGEKSLLRRCRVTMRKGKSNGIRALSHWIY